MDVANGVIRYLLCRTTYSNFIKSILLVGIMCNKRKNFKLVENLFLYSVKFTRLSGTFILLFQIHEFNSVCWDKCIDKPGSKLDSKTEACLNNCVNRFIDVSLLITKRFANLLQKNNDML